MIKRIKLFIIRIVDFLRFKKSYSQDGEDVVLQSFYEGIKNYKGYFIDVGAHHPVRFSNTWSLYRKGWKGINIDPTPNSMRSFNLLRPRDINLEIGIGSEPKDLMFYCFNEPALNTFDPKLAAERNNGAPYKIINEIKIPTFTLADVLDRHLPLNQHIDVLSIDVEGLDLDVLKSNNWGKYVPDFILVEDVDFKIETPLSSPVYCFLNQLGYSLVAKLKRTLVFEFINNSK